MLEVQDVLTLFLSVEGHRICAAPRMDFSLDLPQARKDEVVTHAANKRPEADGVIRIYGLCEKSILGSELYVFVIDVPKNWFPNSALKEHVEQLEGARFRPVNNHVGNASTKPAAADVDNKRLNAFRL